MTQQKLHTPEDGNYNRAFERKSEYRIRLVAWLFALLLNDHRSIRIHGISERGISLNLCAKTANPCVGALRDTVICWWNLTRPGGPKLQRMQNHQRAPVRYFVKSDQIPSRTGAKLSFKGIMCMADEAEMWLILLIPNRVGFA